MEGWRGKKTLGDVGDKSESIIECHVLMRLKWLGTRVRAYSRPPGLQCSHRKNKQVESDTWARVHVWSNYKESSDGVFCFASFQSSLNSNPNYVVADHLLDYCFVHGPRSKKKNRLETRVMHHQDFFSPQTDSRRSREKQIKTFVFI